jgi:RNA polymerase subunit RPABC4/transcription elongation factor Spt4
MKIVINKPMGVKLKSDCLPGDYHKETKARLRGEHISEVLRRTEARIQSPPQQWRIVKCDSQSMLISCLIQGMPGTGKTYRLVTIEIKWAIDNNKSYVALGYTCNSCHNIKSQLPCKECAHVMTFDKFFCDKKSVEDWIQKAKGLDIIFIEEFSMIPKKFIFILFLIKQRYPHIIFRIFGDHNQCAPMDKDWIEYIDCPAFQYLVDYNICTLEYIEGTSRYTRSLYDILIHLLNTGKLHPSLHHKRLNDNVHMSICLTGITIGSATRKRINAEQRLKWLPNSADSGEYVVGMPIASKSNLASLKIMNGQRFTFYSASKQYVMLMQDKSKYQVPVSDFEKNGNFVDGFCDSVFCYQGRTIREPYNIYDVPKMSRQDLYVTLSRFTTEDHIFFDARGLEDHVFDRKKPPPLGKEVRVKVQPYRIYRITSVDKTDDSEYIGYTEKTLQKRLQEHIDKPTNITMAKWMPKSEKKIELIEAITYMTLPQVKKLEAKYIAAVPPEKSMNVQHKHNTRKVTKAVDFNERCNFSVPHPLPVKKKTTPTAKYDAKNKRFKVQKKYNGTNITKYGKTAQEATDKLALHIEELEDEEHEERLLEAAFATLN